MRLVSCQGLTLRGFFFSDHEAYQWGLYQLFQHSGAQLKEIGDRFRIGAAGVSQESRRFAIRLQADSELRKIVEDLRVRMKCVNV
jgi:hypothetical protein